MTHACCRHGLVLALLSAVWSCGDGLHDPETLAGHVPACLGGAKAGCIGTLHVEVQGHPGPLQPWQTLSVPAQAGAAMQPQTFTVRLTNAANGQTAAALKLLHVEVRSTDAGQPWSCAAGGSGAPCESQASRWPLLAPAALASSRGGSVPEVQFSVRLDPLHDKPYKATVCILADGDPQLPHAEFCFWLARPPSPPTLKVQPNPVRFGAHQLHGAATEPLSIRNLGGTPLTLHEVRLDMPHTYTLHAGDLALTGGQIYPFQPPLVLAPQSAMPWSLVRSAQAPPDSGGLLRLKTNDPNYPKGMTIEVMTGPLHQCLALETVVDFGAAIPGEVKTYTLLLKNCSATPLAWTAVDFVPDKTNTTEFDIDWTQSSTPDSAGALAPSVDHPLVVAPGKSAALALQYAPQNLWDVPDVAVVAIHAAGQTYEVKLIGSGATATCPIAKATVDEGDMVVPGTTLHLKGDAAKNYWSVPIAHYQWTVNAPGTTTQKLTPNATFPNPTFKADKPGEYQFCVTVTDAYGIPSCVPSCLNVLVVPVSDLTVTLQWHTPGDPDPTDAGPAASAQLDLHLAHPLAQTLDQDCDGTPDPWFSLPWDAFWANPNPDWGLAGDATDDPKLSQDQSDNPGSAWLGLLAVEGTPAAPVAYSVGVHHWYDAGYGPSLASVQLWALGALVAKIGPVALQPGDLWHVGRIYWPNLANGGTDPLLQRCYQSGSSCASGSNLMWQAKGDACVTPCYTVPKGLGLPAAPKSKACGG